VSSRLCAPGDISNGEKKCLFKRGATARGTKFKNFAPHADTERPDI
jgi:hypothetical protein